MADILKLPGLLIQHGGKMKLTRKQLRKLIAEAFKQKIPLFDPVTQAEIDLLRQTRRQNATDLDASQIAKLSALEQSGDPASVKQARELYAAFGSTEPVTTSQEEKAFLAGQDAMLQDISNFNVIQMHFGEIADYLNSDQLRMLSYMIGNPVHAYHAGDHGNITKVGFRRVHHKTLGTAYITPNEFDIMLCQIYLKNRNPIKSEIDSVNTSQSNEILKKISHDLFKKIIKASTQTSIWPTDLFKYRVADYYPEEKKYQNTAGGYIHIYDDYNKDILDLVNSKPPKLILKTGYTIG